MIVFNRYGLVDAGVEICPMASMLPHMSSGIGAFEQVKWDLDIRGSVEGFDVPGLLIGVTTEKALKTSPSTPQQGTDNVQIELPDIPMGSDIRRNRESILKEKTLKIIRETGLLQ